MSTIEGKKLRQAGIILAKQQDYRVRYLYETCKWMNRNARFLGWNKSIEKFSVDHIVPLNDQGKFGYDNLWICLLEWNIENAALMPKRGMNTIWAIKKAVRDLGNVHEYIPVEVLVAERQDLIEYLGVFNSQAYGLIPRPEDATDESK